MRIFFAGSTGVIGRQLLPALIAAGHEVTAMTRSQQNATALRDAGAEPVVCDVFDVAALEVAVRTARPEIVIHQLTSIPKCINPRRVDVEFAENDRIRTVGTRNLVNAAVAAGARRIVSQSIAFVYAPGSAGLRVESDPLYVDPPASFARMVGAVRDLEAATLETPGIDGVVLRYGFFYGPGTVYASDGSFSDDVKRRRMPLLGPASGVFSFIHLADAVSATMAALTGPPGCYNIVDDTPAPAFVWLPALAARLGAPTPWKVPVWVGRLAAGRYAEYLMVEMPGAANTKAKHLLGWTPRYPSFREGLAADLG